MNSIVEQAKRQNHRLTYEQAAMMLQFNPIYLGQYNRVNAARQNAEQVGVKWNGDMPMAQVIGANDGQFFAQNEPQVQADYGVGKPAKFSDKQWQVMQDFARAEQRYNAAREQANKNKGNAQASQELTDSLKARRVALDAMKAEGVKPNQYSKNRKLVEQSINVVAQAGLRATYQQSGSIQQGTTEQINPLINPITQSVKDSVAENIRNGRASMRTAIAEQRDVLNAMVRSGYGNVDFIWGNEGRVVNKKTGKTKKAMGISHIIEARMRKDHLTFDEVVGMLVNNVVEVIAIGSEKQRSYNKKQKETRLTVERNGYEVILVKPDNANAWVISGYEQKEKSADEQGVGFDTTMPTQSEPTLARQGLGATDNGDTVNLQADTVKPTAIQGGQAQPQQKDEQQQQAPVQDEQQVQVENSEKNPLKTFHKLNRKGKLRMKFSKMGRKIRLK